VNSGAECRNRRLALNVLDVSSMAKVLLIDDDRPTREALAEILGLEGHEIVGQAANGREGVDLLGAGCRPEVIVLDLRMPVMSGWQFLTMLHGTRARVPVIVISAEPELPAESSPVIATFRKSASIDLERLSATIRDAAVRYASVG
jgi:CheY-like chemotaxis protein